MIPTKKSGRTAGSLYLIVVISGILSLMYIPSKIIVWDNAIETYNNIVANQSLFKMGILSSLIMYTTFTFLSIALYKLLSTINKNVAINMLILVLISVPIAYVNLISKLDVLSIINGIDAFQTDNTIPKHAQVMMLIESHSNGILLVQIFWGLWLLPFGYLVFKSDFLPKIFGLLLMIGCFGYLLDFLGHFLFPDGYTKTIIPIIFSLPHALGEIGICIWLLIFGVKEKSKR